MALLSPMVAGAPVRLSLGVVLSIVALGALGTGLAFVWNTTVVAAWGATNASTVTYLTPVVGVLLGVLVLGERVTWSEPVGAALVVLGIAASQGRIRALPMAGAHRGSGRSAAGNEAG
jgi:drug/metabolite transporter (DMT)-like permease